MESPRANLARLLAQDEQERLARYKKNQEHNNQAWKLLREIMNDTPGSNHNINNALCHLLEYGEHISATISGMEKLIAQGDKNEQETGSRQFAVSPNAPWNKVQERGTGSSK